MVKALRTFASATILLAALPARADLNAYLKMSFTKPEIFVGEHVLVNFDLYGNDDAVEAEVSKFPEFRGFWSENLVLRQGPIALGLAALSNTFDALSAMGMPPRKATIGTYLLTAMVGGQPSIEPMKLVVRRLGGGGIDINIASSGTPLKINPLPPVPANLEKSFHGAVGTFNFFLETNTVSFQKDEPVALRFLLQGEGNFQEINELNLQFPPEVEVLSKKSFTQGTGQFSTKTFEITVAVHSDKPILLPGFVFVHFNPVARQYEALTSPPLSLQWQAPVAAALETGPLDLGTPEREPTRAGAVENSLLFWTAQLLCAGAVAAIFWRRFARRRRRGLRHSAAYKRELKLKQALALLDGGDTEGFLRLADGLAYELVARRCPPPTEFTPLTRRRALATAELSAEMRARAESLFLAYEHFSFDPNHRPPSNLSSLRETLVSLARDAA